MSVSVEHASQSEGQKGIASIVKPVLSENMETLKQKKPAKGYEISEDAYF